MRGLIFVVVVALIDVVLSSDEVLIIDTDIGGGGCNDVDDVGALCAALEMERLGEIKIAAIVQSPRARLEPSATRPS